MIGVIDKIETENETVYPIEYKKGERSQSESYKIQLCCYALMLEETYKIDIKKGYIYFVEAKTRVEIAFTEELREAAYDTIDAAKRILKEG